MSKPVPNAVQKAVPFEPGMRVVFTTDVAYKSEKGRVTYVAKVGITGRIKAVNVKTKTLTVDLDRKLSARKPVLEDVKPTWVAPILEPIIMDAPTRTEDDTPNWKGYDYETLKQIALSYNLEWRETENERINKMWVIAALKQAGIEPPEINTDEQAS